MDFKEYRFPTVFVFSILLFLFIEADAELNPSSSSNRDTADSINCGKHIAQKDIIDYLQLTFHFHYPSHEDTSVNKTGRLHISALPGAGYTLTTKFAVTIGANAA